MKTPFFTIAWRDITLRFLPVWRRNWKVYLKTWKVSFLPPLFEPILYLVSFGIGFRLLIDSVPYKMTEVPYIAFMAPGLIAAGIMNGSFFETTYSSFVRMYYQKTFDAIMSAPVSVEEVVLGEIAWGVTRSLITSAIMLCVTAAFGLLSFPDALLVLPVALLGGFGFACLGMTFTGIIPNIDLFNIPTFLLITPMFLFSGTFFPLDTMPEWVQSVAYFLPLTHLVNLVRSLCLGLPDIGEVLLSVAYLAVFSGIFLVLALATMRRRLIK